MISKKDDTRIAEKGSLRELEEVCAKLLQTARKIPPGPARQTTLKEIGKFRVRISTLKAERR